MSEVIQVEDLKISNSHPEAMDRVRADVQTAKDELVSRAAAGVLEKVEW
jgi:hypothetical protein